MGIDVEQESLSDYDPYKDVPDNKKGVIESLWRMVKKGKITIDEFEEEKKKILNE